MYSSIVALVFHCLPVFLISTLNTELFCTYMFVLVKFSFPFSVVTAMPSLLSSGEGSGSIQPPHIYAYIWRTYIHFISGRLCRHICRTNIYTCVSVVFIQFVFMLYSFVHFIFVLSIRIMLLCLTWCYVMSIVNIWLVKQ